MGNLNELMDNIDTNTGKSFALALAAMANVVQSFSNDPANPNVSAWLRSGAIEMIAKVEQEAAVLDEW